MSYKFLIVGCGSIGEHHTKNLLSCGQEVMVYDKDLQRAKNLVDKYGVIIYDFKSKHLPINAFIICTPPNFHVPFAFEALEHNSHIFIEKPLSHNLNRVDELLTQIKKQDRILQIGYQLRFHPGLRLAKKLLDEGKIGKLLSIRAEFGQYLPDWHPDEDYRNLYTAHEDQGGGIILDASHEVDYCRWLSSSEVTRVACFANKMSSLEVDTEDNASILLSCRNNLNICICLDFNNRIYTRKCKLIGEEGTIYWDYKYPSVNVYYSDRNWEQLSSEYSDPYFEEMKHFISCIEGKTKPIVDGETGKRVLEIALAAKQSARERRVIEWDGIRMT